MNYSQETKDKARQLRTQGMSYNAISRALGASSVTIATWCDPERAAKHKQASANSHLKFRERNLERMRQAAPKYVETRAEYKRSGRLAEVSRAYSQRPEVKAANCLRNLNRYHLQRADEMTLDESELAAINAFYYEAQRLTELTGEDHEVDHILPIAKGGSHAAYNLQVLTAYKNRSKGCNFRPEDRALYTQRIAAMFL